MLEKEGGGGTPGFGSSIHSFNHDDDDDEKRGLFEEVVLIRYLTSSRRGELAARRLCSMWHFICSGFTYFGVCGLISLRKSSVVDFFGFVLSMYGVGLGCGYGGKGEGDEE